MLGALRVLRVDKVVRTGKYLREKFRAGDTSTLLGSDAARNVALHIVDAVVEI